MAMAPSKTGTGGRTYGKPVEQMDVEMGSPPVEWAGSSWDQGLGDENRANFLWKVYGILSAQMAVTVAICTVAMLVPPIQTFFVHMIVTPWASLMLFIPSMGVLCALHMYKAEHPTNYYLLMAFTVLMSMSIAGTCAAYQKAGLGNLILEAFGLTAGAFCGLSAYALKSGKDFTWMGGMLSMGLMGMIAFSFFGMLFGFSGGAFFSLLGAMLFCGYILYDTDRIAKECGPDDAILACIELYLDILNLFRSLLALLSALQDDD